MKKFLLILLPILFFGLIIVGSWLSLKRQQKILIIDNRQIIQSRKKDLPVKAFITPHHLLAEELMRKIFVKVAKENKGREIARLIIVSPNHFQRGQGGIIISDQNWSLGQRILPAKLAVSELNKLDFVFTDNKVFSGEHGIQNLLPLAEEYFPQVPILSMLVGEDIPWQNLESLAEAIASLPGNTLLILSSDFSHYLSAAVADWHDQKAIGVIKHFDYPAIYDLETDCRSGLYLLLKFAELNQQKEFTLLDHSSSAQIYQQDVVGQNTSYVTGYFSEKNKKSEKDRREDNDNKPGRAVTFLFLGDLMLDRFNRRLIQEHGTDYFTQPIERLFWSQDLNVVNLEGPITMRASVSVAQPVSNPNHFKFTFAPQTTIGFLQGRRINVVNLGNNHILNFGRSGLQQTERFLEEGKIAYFGDPIEQEKSFVIQKVGDQQIALVSYNQFAGSTVKDVIQLIKKLRPQVDYLIVYPHWGVEYQAKPTSRQRQLAHQFIDAGADLIVGAHPHVVQSLEIYRDKPIFYSLGNFIFDQYFSPAVRTMLGVGVLLEGKKATFTLIPLWREKSGQVRLLDQAEKRKFFSDFVGQSFLNKNIREQVLHKERFEL